MADELDGGDVATEMEVLLAASVVVGSVVTAAATNGLVEAGAGNALVVDPASSASESPSPLHVATTSTTSTRKTEPPTAYQCRGNASTLARNLSGARIIDATVARTQRLMA